MSDCTCALGVVGPDCPVHRVIVVNRGPSAKELAELLPVLRANRVAQYTAEGFTVVLDYQPDQLLTEPGEPSASPFRVDESADDGQDEG